MNYTTFNKSRLAVSVALLMGAAGQPVLAQEADDAAEPQVEVIEVQGIRGSLLRAMDLKRSTPGVMDAISAEEMGKFPDSNLAESLMRIPGVTVSRNNGEGSQITVRGFGPEFNLITLNGRQMPGTGFTRSYSLENLSAEGVKTLEVYKTSTVANPSGGLGATVNIVTTKPLAQLIVKPTSLTYMPPVTVIVDEITAPIGGPPTGGGGEGDGGGGDAAGGVTEKVVVNGPEPDGIVNVWPKAVSVLPFQPSPHASVIESEHDDAVVV